jgi:hypothetical protein
VRKFSIRKLKKFRSDYKRLHKAELSEAEWEAENDSARTGFWKTALMLPMLHRGYLWNQKRMKKAEAPYPIDNLGIRPVGAF